MKRNISVIVLLALSALLCGCQEPNTAETESAVVTESSVSEPADCCGGEIPDCCKTKEESGQDCCEGEDSEKECCRENEEAKEDCCKEESESDCCKHDES